MVLLWRLFCEPDACDTVRGLKQGGLERQSLVPRLEASLLMQGKGTWLQRRGTSGSMSKEEACSKFEKLIGEIDVRGLH